MTVGSLTPEAPVTHVVPPGAVVAPFEALRAAAARDRDGNDGGKRERIVRWLRAVDGTTQPDFAPGRAGEGIPCDVPREVPRPAACVVPEPDLMTVFRDLERRGFPVGGLCAVAVGYGDRSNLRALYRDGPGLIAEGHAPDLLLQLVAQGDRARRSRMAGRAGMGDVACPP